MVQEKRKVILCICISNGKESDFSGIKLHSLNSKKAFGK